MKRIGDGGGIEDGHDAQSITSVAGGALKLIGAEVPNREGVCCCNTSQVEAFVVIGITVILTGILWRSAVLAPVKLVAVFLHEFSHASATWLTCGKVSGINVNEHFGGVTLSRGGSRWIILSAGYTGSVFWGGFFILMTWDKWPTRVAAVVFMVSCLATAILLKVEDKRICGLRCAFSLTMRILILVLGSIPAAMWVLEENVKMAYHPIRYTMLMMGTICVLHALYDTINDVLCKRISNASQGKSDAVMFAEEICGSPRCWGLLWTLIAIAAAAGSVFLLTMLSGKCQLL